MDAAQPLIPGTPELPVESEVQFDAERRHETRAGPRSTMRSFILTFFVVALVAAFLSPMVRALTISLKTQDQISQTNSPVWPADPATFSYQGEDYELFKVPINGETREMALVTRGRTESEFVDPTNTAAGLITLDGSWRRLERVWKL